jgi:hypothetical protein
LILKIDYCLAATLGREVKACPLYHDVHICLRPLLLESGDHLTFLPPCALGISP